MIVEYDMMIYTFYILFLKIRDVYLLQTNQLTVDIITVG